MDHRERSRIIRIYLWISVTEMSNFSRSLAQIHSLVFKLIRHAKQ